MTFNNQSSIRRCLTRKPPIWRSHATAHDPSTFFLQPLDPSCRRQSLRRGFSISLPILIIYTLLYLSCLVLLKTELGQYYKNTVARFWVYQRADQNVASLCTYVTSQFTHDGLIPLVIDSLLVVGVASILGSVFNRPTFFAVYVLGGFLAAAADCAWAQLTNPCRSLTQAQLDQNDASIRVFAEAFAKMKAMVRPTTIREIVELWSNPQDDWVKEFIKQQKIVDKAYSSIRDWDKWKMPNSAASGSLVCLASVATLIRPRTIINFLGLRPRLVLYKLTAGFFILSLCSELASSPGSSYRVCLGGNLAAVLLWFLWLRKGHIGTLASGLRAFDQLNKPAIQPLMVILGNHFWSLTIIGVISFFEKQRRIEAHDATAARVPEPPQSSDESENTPPLELGEDAPNDEGTQGETLANQAADGDHDKVPENDKD